MASLNCVALAKAALENAVPQYLVDKLIFRDLKAAEKHADKNAKATTRRGSRGSNDGNSTNNDSTSPNATKDRCYYLNQFASNGCLHFIPETKAKMSDTGFDETAAYRKELTTLIDYIIGSLEFLSTPRTALYSFVNEPSILEEIKSLLFKNQSYLGYKTWEADEFKLAECEKVKSLLSSILDECVNIGKLYTESAHTVPSEYEDSENSGGSSSTSFRTASDFFKQTKMPCFETLCKRIARVRKEFDFNFTTSDERAVLASIFPGGRVSSNKDEDSVIAAAVANEANARKKNSKNQNKNANKNGEHNNADIPFVFSKETDILNSNISAVQHATSQVRTCDDFHIDAKNLSQFGFYHYNLNATISVAQKVNYIEDTADESPQNSRDLFLNSSAKNLSSSFKNSNSLDMSKTPFHNNANSTPEFYDCNELGLYDATLLPTIRESDLQLPDIKSVFSPAASFATLTTPSEASNRVNNSHLARTFSQIEIETDNNTNAPNNTKSKKRALETTTAKKATLQATESKLKEEDDFAYPSAENPEVACELLGFGSTENDSSLKRLLYVREGFPLAKSKHFLMSENDGSNTHKNNGKILRFKFFAKTQNSSSDVCLVLRGELNKNMILQLETEKCCFSETRQSDSILVHAGTVSSNSSSSASNEVLSGKSNEKKLNESADIEAQEVALCTFVKKLLALCPPDLVTVWFGYATAPMTEISIKCLNEGNENYASARSSSKNEKKNAGSRRGSADGFSKRPASKDLKSVSDQENSNLIALQVMLVRTSPFPLILDASMAGSAENDRNEEANNLTQKKKRKNDKDSANFGTTNSDLAENTNLAHLMKRLRLHNRNIAQITNSFKIDSLYTSAVNGNDAQESLLYTNVGAAIRAWKNDVAGIQMRNVRKMIHFAPSPIAGSPIGSPTGNARTGANKCVKIPNSSAEKIDDDEVESGVDVGESTIVKAKTSKKEKEKDAMKKEISTSTKSESSGSKESAKENKKVFENASSSEFDENSNIPPLTGTSKKKENRRESGGNNSRDGGVNDKADKNVSNSEKAEKNAAAGKDGKNSRKNSLKRQRKNSVDIKKKDDASKIDDGDNISKEPAGKRQKN